MTKQFLLRGMIAGLLLTGAVHAGNTLSSSTYSGVPLTSTPWGGAGSDGILLQGLQGFDPGLGRLTQVQLSFSGQISQTLFATNSSTTPVSYSLVDQLYLTIGTTTGLKLAALGPFEYSLGSTVSGKLPGLGNLSSTQFTPVAFQQTFTDPVVLASLSGSRPVDLIVNAFESGSSHWIDGNRGTGGSGSAASLSVVTLDYTYTQIPEPKTYAALLGLAVFGLVLARRRCSTID